MTSVCRVAFVLSSLRHSNSRYCTWATRVIQGSYELSSDVAIPYGGLQLIATFFRDCEGCAVCEKSMKPTQPPLQPIHWPEKPWQHIQINIYGNVLATPLSQRFLVVVHDVHPKWPEIAATSTVTSSAIIQIPFTDAVRTILQTYRSTPHTLTQRTQAELMIGRKLRFPLECLKPPQICTLNITVLAESIRRKQERTKAYTDKRRHSRDTSMKRGYWVRTKRPIRKHKLASSLSYPKRIAKKVGPNTFVLEDGSRWN